MIIVPIKDKRYFQCSKKLAALRKLYRLEMITEQEYVLAKNKIMDSCNLVDNEILASYKD